MSNPMPAVPPALPTSAAPTLIKDSSELIQPLIKLSLVNAETNQIVEGYEDLAVNNIIDLSQIDLTQYSLIAQINQGNPIFAAIESVRLQTQSVNRVENIEPYALFGDISGDYFGQSLAAGDYSVTVTAYTEDNGQGTAISPSQAFTYTVIDSAVLPPAALPTPEPTLCEEDSGESGMAIADGLLAPGLSLLGEDVKVAESFGQYPIALESAQSTDPLLAEATEFGLGASEATCLSAAENNADFNIAAIGFDVVSTISPPAAF